jgi:hypothetical protein
MNVSSLPGQPSSAAQDRADRHAIALAVLALHDAGGAFLRMLGPANACLARGLASHLAERLEAAAVPADLADACDAIGRDASAAHIAAVEILRADGSSVPPAESRGA